MICREGSEKDIKAVFELIKELANYEKAELKLTNDLDQMICDGFREDPIYKILIAEKNNNVIGTIIYYFRYSTWKGKIFYVEDFIVKKGYRRKGIGQNLLNYARKIAYKNKCKGISLQVLNWNTNAKDFYEKNSFTFDDEWINCYLKI